MPFTWQININKTGGSPGYTYEPNPLTQVQTGDQIFWTNNNDVPHWPGIDGNQTYFLPNQIAPNSPSTTFIPGVNASLTYKDSLDKSANAPTGTINVGPTTVT